MSEDMSDMMNKINEMLSSKDMPDDIKNLINNFSSNSNNEDNSDMSSNSDNSQSEKSAFPDIDINMMLKMKSIMDSMNSNKNDPRSNLLRSLKPYLKESRKEKVDQYVQIFSMGKIFEAFNPLGGEKKNDI